MSVDLALSTGLRVSEMATLKMKDIDLKREAISVVRLKRKKKKKETMAIGKDFKQHLQQFIKFKKILYQPVKPTSEFFTGGRGPLTAQGLQKVWKAAVKRAGLPKEITIHCAPAMPNGRCRMHGGKSTGPRTPACLERSRKANWKHGRYPAKSIAIRREMREFLRNCWKTIELVEGAV